ncbi:hypothetical protein [Pseudomonas sp. GL-B-19]|uniref:hypothetical protein n=1 Tax=Pseudomonas sp. GL-B-19 TaxID=2832393 RepID=UPI001CBF161E|nr:hypothetical protein [Pseudomonas sp. GL-B-19]
MSKSTLNDELVPGEPPKPGTIEMLAGFSPYSQFPLIAAIESTTCLLSTFQYDPAIVRANETGTPLSVFGRLLQHLDELLVAQLHQVGEMPAPCLEGHQTAVSLP